MYEYFPELFNNFDKFFQSIGFKRKSKLWIKEYDKYILIFRLRKHTKRESVFVDCGMLLKFINDTLYFSEFDWHLSSGLGEFDRDKYALGIEKDDDISDYFPFINKVVIPEMLRVGDVIYKKNEFKPEDYSFIGPIYPEAIKALEKYLKI